MLKCDRCKVVINKYDPYYIKKDGDIIFYYCTINCYHNIIDATHTDN